MKTANVLDELSRSNHASPRSSADRKKQTGQRRTGILLLLLFPLLLLVAFLGYQQWILQREVIEFIEANNILQDRLNQSDSRIRQLEIEVSQTEQDPRSDGILIDQLRRDFVNETDRLNALVTALQNQRANLQSVEGDGWRLVEAEYLLDSANQQLQISGKIPLVVSLLESAESVLARSTDSRVYSVRQVLGRELTQLRQVDVSDSQPLYGRLASLRVSVDQLADSDSIQESYSERLSTAPVPPLAEATPVQSFLDAALNFLSSVFIWREWDEVPDIQYPLQQGAQAKQNINLMLEQAQLAVMQGEAELYKSALSQARRWTNQYLRASDGNPSRLIEEIDSLLLIDLNPQLPDISQSLALIRQLTSPAVVNDNRL